MTATRNVSMMITMQDKASAAIKEVNKNMDTLVKKADGAGGKIDSITKSMDKMGKKMGSAGKKLTKGLTLPLVGVGTAAAATVSNFDDAMANVQKISGATGKEFDDLRAKAMELGSTTAYSASAAADGMGVLAASGMKANDVIAVSEDMFNLMSAGSVDANTAASVLTNTMAQFNMTADESDKIVDTFAATSAKSKISVDQLEHGMSIAGATMAGMNMDVQDATAAFGHLANAGMPVEQLGTAINAMGREIKANAGDFKEVFNIDVYDPVTGAIKDMGTVMKELEDATAGMTDQQRDAALSTVFSGQAMQGATNWLNQGADAYSSLTDEIIREQNAAKTMAAIQEDTIGGAFRAVKSATEGFMIEVGDILKGPLQNIAKWIADLAGRFGKLSTPMKRLIVGFGAIAAAIGPILLIGSKLLTGGSKAIGLFKKVGVAISGISLPMVAGVAAAALLGVAIYRLWKTNEEFRSGVIRIWDSIKTKLSEVLGAMQRFWETHGETIRTTVSRVFEVIGQVISVAFGAIVTVVSTVLGVIAGFWSRHGETIMGAASLAWNTIKSVISGAMQVIQGVMNIVLGVIQGDWSTVWTGIQGIFEGVMTAVSAAWDAAKQVVGKVIEGTVSAITDKFHSAVDKAKKAWQGLKNFMKNPIKGTVNAARRGAGWVKDKITDGTHATGAYNIPFDGYIGELHKGEMVLTKAASDRYRVMGGTENKVPPTQLMQSDTYINNYMSESYHADVPSREVTTRAEYDNRRNTNFSPTINIEIKGNADKDTIDDLEIRMKRVFAREQDKFWAKLASQQ